MKPLFCQNDENGPGDFLRLMRIAHLPHGDRINQIDVPRYQRGKRFFGIVFRILPQQRAVVRRLHSAKSVPNHQKPTNYLQLPLTDGWLDRNLPGLMRRLHRFDVPVKEKLVAHFPVGGPGRQQAVINSTG